MGSLGRLLEAALGAVAGYLRTESGDPVGRVNIACGLVLVVLAGIALVPNLVLEVVRVFLDRPSPDWTASIPLVAFSFLVLYFYLSLKLIPPR